MKISEFLQDFFTTTVPTGNPVWLDNYKLDSKALQLPYLKQLLLSCDEFKKTKKIIIIPSDGENIDISSTITHKLHDGTRFNEVVYLHSISLSPGIYNPNVLSKPIKDGITISPNLYNEETFIPYKTLRIEWAPEHSLDKNMSDEDFQAEFFARIKKALDNPEEYTPIPERGIFIRCTPDSFFREETSIEDFLGGKTQTVRIK